ncbi:MAG: hypothetical protein DWQ36_07130 [Acidobacteria bacterium]|nr:MAG: hypothetical protein DWQ30_24565 [Acidobacteriota bacterium]REK09314.1 MAG: hypothetical protein DWQ36_07130 [Acidobacteriota bacterium]
MPVTTTILLSASLLALPTAVTANTADAASDDHAAVRAAVLDYVEGIYEVTPERIERSVHPELAKVGWGRDAEGNYNESPMTQQQLVDLAGSYNKDGRIPADAPKEIEVYDVLDKTASVKLTAAWGIDYMHLVKLDGRWMIRNVIWQSHPPQE